MNIYVGNLSYNVGEEDLREIFEEYGEVASIKIITDKFSGKSKGFGFVEMPNKEEATNAIRELNDTEVDSRKIRVNEARERDDSRSGGQKNKNN